MTSFKIKCKTCKNCLLFNECLTTFNYSTINYKNLQAVRNIGAFCGLTMGIIIGVIDCEEYEEKGKS